MRIRGWQRGKGRGKEVVIVYLPKLIAQWEGTSSGTQCTVLVPWAKRCAC